MLFLLMGTWMRHLQPQTPFCHSLGKIRLCKGINGDCLSWPSTLLIIGWQMQDICIETMAKIMREEVARNPRTLFVVSHSRRS